MTDDVVIHPADTRGRSESEFLTARHTLNYHDWGKEGREPIGPLETLNETDLAAEMAFPWHEHEGIEVVTYVRQGAMFQRNRREEESVVKPGEIQVNRTGPGVEHQAANAVEDRPLRFIEIELRPRDPPDEVSREKTEVPSGEGWSRIGAPRSETEAPLGFDADVRLDVGRFDGGETLERSLDDGRQGYLFVVEGAVTVDGDALEAGGSALFRGHRAAADAREDTEVLFLDLPHDR